MAENNNTYTIDDLFKDFDESLEDNTQQEPDKNDITTEAVSKRINEVRAKTEAETRDSMAKELGYENYADWQKSKENQLLRENGLDEEGIKEVVEKLVESRIANDPRMAKIAELEAVEKNNFVTKQINEINELGYNFKSIEDLPKETLNLWEKIGNLKQAFLATEGEKMFTKQKSEIGKGTVMHQGYNGSSSSGKTRGLTEEERKIYRMVYKGNITEEELDKIRKDI